MLATPRICTIDNTTFFPFRKLFGKKNVFLSLTTNFFPTFAGSFFGRVASSRRDDTIVTLDKRSAVGGNTNKRLPQCFDRLSNHVTALRTDNNNITT